MCEDDRGARLSAADSGGVDDVPDARRRRDRKGGRFVLTVERVLTIGPPDRPGRQKDDSPGSKRMNQAEIADQMVGWTGSRPSANHDRRGQRRPPC